MGLMPFPHLKLELYPLSQGLTQIANSGTAGNGGHFITISDTHFRHGIKPSCHVSFFSSNNGKKIKPTFTGQELCLLLLVSPQGCFYGDYQFLSALRRSSCKKPYIHKVYPALLLLYIFISPKVTNGFILVSWVKKTWAQGEHVRVPPAALLIADFVFKGCTEALRLAPKEAYRFRLTLNTICTITQTLTVKNIHH